MSAVKGAVEAGLEPRQAVKAALGMSIADFSRQHGLREDTVSGVISGSTPYPYNATRDAIAAHLGVDREWLDEQLPVPGRETSSTK